MTANDYIQQTGHNKICNCGRQKYCSTKDCKRDLPDREELIEGLRDVLMIWQFSDTSEGGKLFELLKQCKSYIQATPLTVITEAGRKLCTCSQQHVDLSRYGGIAQAMMDEDIESRGVPMPSERQWAWFGKLFTRASFSQRRKVVELVGVKDLKKLMIEIIRILINT